MRLEIEINYSDCLVAGKWPINIANSASRANEASKPASRLSLNPLARNLWFVG